MQPPSTSADAPASPSDSARNDDRDTETVKGLPSRNPGGARVLHQHTGDKPESGDKMTPEGFRFLLPQALPAGNAGRSRQSRPIAFSSRSAAASRAETSGNAASEPTSSV